MLLKKGLLLCIMYCATAQSQEDHAAIFNAIYKNGVWGNQETRSGYGSRMESTQTIRNILPVLINALQIKTILDAPCGDFNWMKAVDLGGCTYLGIDIVQELIINNEHYADEKRNFRCLNALYDTLPCADLIICRDLIAHLKFTDTVALLQNFKNSNSHYILITTYSKCPQNCEDNFPTGEWHPVNLMLPPFRLPPPLMLFEESAPQSLDTHFGKSLGLWRLQDLQF